MKEYYAESAEAALADLGTTPNGLSDEEAAKRLTEYGENKLKEGKKISLARRFVKQLLDPMIIVLCIAAVVSLVVAIIEGGEGIAEVVIIAVVVLLNAVLGVVQESKADSAIEALKEMTAATSKVLRGGRQLTVKSSELTVGDVVVLEAGDAVGYGRAGKLLRPTVTATVPIGYADGLDRHLGCGRWSMRVAGRPAPIVGRVCMDSCMIDITDIPGVGEGDEVTVFSAEPGNDLETMARVLDTIPYEIMTSVSSRVKRIYLKE